MNYEDSLLKQIQKYIIHTSSINDLIATILNVSYGPADRRFSGKSKFSIDEALQLVNHFNISLDTLFLKKSKLLERKQLKLRL
jgi:hypothetical protein